MQSGAETNIEEILALEPQIVLMSDMSQTEEQAKLLEQNGLRHIRFHDLRHPYVKPTTKKFITFFEVFRAAS